MIELIQYYSTQFYNYVLYLGLLLIPFGLFLDFFRKKLSSLRIKETLQSLFTLIPYGLMEYLAVLILLPIQYFIASFLPYQIPITIWTFLLTILVADLMYYIGHLFGHKLRLFWGSHQVHHNSPDFNLATAYRFSPFDPFAVSIFSTSMVFMGFHPLAIVSADIIVLAYQFWLHSDIIPRLGFLEYIINTPSSHRVHHGAQGKYLDKNFGGILIIWDILFGTYQREEEKVKFGVPNQIYTQNPLKVWFYEFYRIFQDMRKAPSLKESFLLLFRHPFEEIIRGLKE